MSKGPWKNKEQLPEGWTKPRPPSYYKKMLAAQNKRRQADPEKYKAMGRKSEHKRRMKRYGVDELWYEFKLQEQLNLCDICLETLVPGKTTHIDHNHTTGKVRGLLCNHCNYLIGNAKEDKFRLMQAIKYLEKYDVCPAATS